jgi:hypothetical protein
MTGEAIKNKGASLNYSKKPLFQVEDATSIGFPRCLAWFSINA